MPINKSLMLKCNKQKGEYLKGMNYEHPKVYDLTHKITGEVITGITMKQFPKQRLWDYTIMEK